MPAKLAAQRLQPSTGVVNKNIGVGDLGQAPLGTV